MDHLEVDGRLFEFTVLSEGHGDQVSVECFDLSPADGDLVGVLRVGASGRGRLVLYRDTAVEVLRRWLQIAERDAGLSEG